MKYVAPLYTTGKVTATEAYARAFSWGLCQVMGQVARETGYAGPLPHLCDPTIGIEIGCQVLRKKLDRHSGNVVDGLLAWNGGARPEYAAEVVARMKNYG